jgi:peptidoglycan hydrolase FlgJ
VNPVGGVTPSPNPPGGTAATEASRIRQVAQDFEAMLLSHMLGSMRQAAGKGVVGGKGQQIYQQMMDDELGKVLSRGGGIGLTEALVRDLVRQSSAVENLSSSGDARSISTPDGGGQQVRREGGLK